MKLLFSADDKKSSAEIKELIGYVNANLKFVNLKSDIKTATNDVISLIGKEVYDYAADLYIDGQPEANYDEQDINLINAIRYPILVNAYRTYVQSNDLAHTGDGRKMQNDDHQKAAFEWQIERDNKAQEKRYYRALDDLIKFLDDSKPAVADPTSLYNLWIASDSFKQSQKLFIRTTDDFKEFFPIESRYLLLMLAPGISFCESREIMPRMGLPKFEDLKLRMKEATPITDEKELKLISLIKEACASYALAWAIPRMSIQIFPEGVVQSFTSERMTQRATKPALMSEPEAARIAFMTTFNRVAKDIEDLLTPTPEVLTDIPTNPPIIYGDKYLST